MQGQQLLYKIIENAPYSIHKKTISSVTNAVGALLIRRIATHYDKLAITFMGAILVGSILIWLKG